MAASKLISAKLVLVSNDIPKIPAQLHDEAVKLVAQHAFAIEAAGKEKAVVRTGTMRRSIHTVFSANGMTATIGPSVLYSIFVEFGTRRMAARPYMRPAAELVLPTFVEAMKRLVRGLG